MVTRLILIAHAETRAALQGVFARDDSLSNRGHEAARAYRGSLPQHDRVIASPAPAARETAAALGLAPLVDPALRGLDVGRWTGRSLPDIAADDPGGANAWMADPDYAGHGGDTVAGLIARLASWLDHRKRAAGTVLAVTHAPVVRAAVVGALEGSAGAFWRIDVAPLTALTLTSDGRRWMVRSLIPAP